MVRTIRSQSKDNELIENRRYLIMQSAAKVFMKENYGSATMQQIAKACGMTSGNLYRYIGSKKDILHICCEYSKKAADSFNDKLKEESQDDVIIDLKHGIQSFFKICDGEAADRIVVYTREQPNLNKEDKELLRQAIEDFVEIFEEIIEKGIEQGLFYAKDPRFLAHHIVFLGYDWCLRRLYMMNICDLGKYTEQHTEMIMDCILKKENHIRRVEASALR